MLSTALLSLSVALFSLHAITLSLFFNAFQHQASLPSSCMYLLLGNSLFLNLHRIHYNSFNWFKMATTEFDLCRWLQKCCFMVINTYCINMKAICIRKDFTGSFFTAYSVSCQFSDIGSYNQLSNEQKRSISEQTRLFARNVP